MNKQNKKKVSIIERLRNKGRLRTIHTETHGDHYIAEYDIDNVGNIGANEELSKGSAFSTPKIHNQLKKRMVVVPEVISQATGITILERNIKSLIFTTDITIILNSNADAVMAVYPFTPQLNITQAILQTANIPVFVGIGGGVTSGERSKNIGLQAELMGAYGVVVNAPMKPDNIKNIEGILDIPIISTVVSENDDYMSKIEAGVQILNVSAGANTAKVVREIRNRVGKSFPIIATGGPNDKTILETIEAGANAITYTPPSTSEIFESIMKDYRENAWYLDNNLVYYNSYKRQISTPLKSGVTNRREEIIWINTKWLLF